VTNVTLTVGTYNLPIVAPLSAAPGKTFARCRISTAGGLTPLGFAADGEVEDHTLTVVQKISTGVAGMTASPRPALALPPALWLKWDTALTEPMPRPTVTGYGSMQPLTHRPMQQMTTNMWHP